MARTILEIAKEAAERDATAPAPTTLFNTGNRVAKILRTAASDTMREYTTKTNWIGSSELHSTWVFSTVPGRYAYPLPPDFLRIIPNTENRGGAPLGLVGPATPQAWANWLFGSGAGACQMAWRIRNNAIWLNDTPTAYELITIDYVSRFPVVSLIEEGDYDMSKSPPVCNAPFVPRDGYLVVPDQLDITTDGTALFDQQPGWDTGVFGEEQSEALRRLNPDNHTEALTALAPEQPFSFKASDIAFEVLTGTGPGKPAPYLARARWVWFADLSTQDDAEVTGWPGEIEPGEIAGT